jgi:hypothetical protein
MGFRLLDLGDLRNEFNENQEALISRVAESTPFEVRIEKVNRFRIRRIKRGGGRITYRRKRVTFAWYTIRRKDSGEYARSILKTRWKSEFLTYLNGIFTYHDDYLMVQQRADTP